MLDFLELEETVGRAWHRLVGQAASYPTYPTQAATLAECRGELGVMFRALGGEVAVQLVGSGAKVSGHRLGWRQRIGLGEERLEQPGRDAATFFLPERIALFDDACLNRALYRWLAAWFAVVPVVPNSETDPLRRDLIALRRAHHTTRAVLTAFPGLGTLHRELCGAVAAARPRRSLPKVESEIEAVILGLLGAEGPLTSASWRAVVAAGELPVKAPPGYQPKPMLPCPLWGDAFVRDDAAPRDSAEEEVDATAASSAEQRRRAAKREPRDDAAPNAIRWR
jgi:nitric oxide reductase NorD protein